MNLRYAQHLQLPIQKFPESHMVFNIDGTPNKSGEIKYYTDLKVQTGQNHTMFRFFLTNIGDSKVILGYPWMAAVQPQIDWKKGWIDHAQLPVVLCTPDAHKAQFLPREVNIQLLKKLSQCLAISKRLTWDKSNKLSNILKIIYIIF